MCSAAWRSDRGGGLGIIIDDEDNGIGFGHDTLSPSAGNVN